MELPQSGSGLAFISCSRAQTPPVPSDPVGPPDSRPEHPSQRLPHAEAELPDLAAVHLLDAGR